MGPLFSANPGKVQVRGGKWGSSEYLLLIGAICMFSGTVWLGWRYDKFQTVRRFWPESVDEGRLPAVKRHSHVVNITLVESAVGSGAVCLDGSPPAYFLDRGTDKGINHWVLFLEGGGWCNSDDSCFERSFTELGSSRHMLPHMRMGGILSSFPSVNPDFYNWNRVLIKYCDGGSFNGDVSEPKQVDIQHDGRHSMEKSGNLYFRGQRIWKAVMKDLFERGMRKAEKALLTGCSAGGLASILHCDQFRDLMPKKARVKCSSDAGFFLDIPDVSGAQTIEAFYKEVVLLQNMVGSLPKGCTSQMDETKCIFPQYLIQGIRTPFFILNPGYDTWQVDNILIPHAADPEGTWDDCRKGLIYCSETELKVVQGFRDDLLKALRPIIENEKDGAFVDSCFTHCQSQMDSTWNSLNGPRIDNKSIAQVVGDWYFERNSSEVIDCPFPCNPTC